MVNIPTEQYWKQQELNKLTENQIKECIESIGSILSIYLSNGSLDKIITTTTINIGRHSFNKEELHNELSNRKNELNNNAL